MSVVNHNLVVGLNSTTNASCRQVINSKMLRTGFSHAHTVITMQSSTTLRRWK